MSKQTSRGHFVCEKDNFKKTLQHLVGTAQRCPRGRFNQRHHVAEMSTHSYRVTGPKCPSRTRGAENEPYVSSVGLHRALESPAASRRSPAHVCRIGHLAGARRADTLYETADASTFRSRDRFRPRVGCRSPSGTLCSGSVSYQMSTLNITDEPARHSSETPSPCPLLLRTGLIDVGCDALKGKGCETGGTPERWAASTRASSGGVDGGGVAWSSPLTRSAAVLTSMSVP